MDNRSQVDQVLNLTQAMLAATQLDDWDEFELLETQRSALLKMIFGDRTDGESTKLYLSDVIEKIQLIDRTISDLISHQRDQAAQELRNLKHARNGNKAYRLTSDDSDK